MSWWANFWGYITTPTNGSLAPTAQALIIAGMLVAAAGILLYILAEPLTRRLIARADRKARPNTGLTARPDQQKNPHPDEIGPGEYGLRPAVYYIALLAHPVTEHDLHQLGMFVAALLGYLIGLAISLGDGVRSASFWARDPRG